MIVLTLESVSRIGQFAVRFDIALIEMTTHCEQFRQTVTIAHYHQLHYLFPHSEATACFRMPYIQTHSVIHARRNKHTRGGRCDQSISGVVAARKQTQHTNKQVIRADTMMCIYFGSCLAFEITTIRWLYHCVCV